MPWIVYHIASGQAFFTGVALILVAVASSIGAGWAFPRLAGAALLLGSFAVVVSSTPLPYWMYVVVAGCTVTWVVSLYRESWHRWAPYATCAAWFMATAMELPYHVMPSLHPAESRRMAILGDSVTAGVGDDETSETWPTILAHDHQLLVQDLSHVGETAGSALKRVRSHFIVAPVVILEIGGNDILGSTTSSQFAEDLDALLAFLTAKDRQVVMFELPLPPLFHEYGRVQRVLAAKHNVRLIPKRALLAVLAANGSTLDTIHLSQSGHQLMAECVWEVVQPAYP